jgi:flagellar motor switch protein FliG
MMAEIFNSLDRATESRIMESLERAAPDSAEKIRNLMFTFEDLSRLDGTSVQTIIRAVDKDKLPIALKGATDTLKDLFFSNMSERAAKIMKEDMGAMGPVRLKEVEEAQQYIVNVAKDLESRGEIILAKSGNSDDEMIF